MHRFYLSPAQAHGDQITLGGREAHHALQVLRLREGTTVVVLDGAGQVLHCEVTRHTRDSLSLAVRERKLVPHPRCSFTLVQAIPKGKIIEDIVQKATELGVSRIVPLLSERVVTQLDQEDAKAKADKWQQVAVEAIKQCGSAWLPKVEAPLTPRAFLGRERSNELSLIGCLEEGSRSPRVWLEKFSTEHQRLPKSLGVWIGPEGDFSASEYAMIKAAGVLPITLGCLVLRVETAAIYALSVISYELSAARI